MTSEVALEVPRWFCERCHSRLRGDGRILIDLDAEDLHWMIAHDRCLEAQELAIPHFVHDRDIQTWRKVAMWTDHFTEKAWFARSDWWRVIRSVGGWGPLIG